MKYPNCEVVLFDSHGDRQSIINKTVNAISKHLIDSGKNSQIIRTEIDEYMKSVIFSELDELITITGEWVNVR